ncbi:hypothetical protein BDQ17DRAFT_1342857 [Cyathus striatus]|nr:hypothetical protein BDQ17DRAFT_1342857 [Cyathus striatus]
MTESVSDLLGYEPHELLVHPDEFSRTKQLHYDTIKQDKAAVLCYLRMKHKDPYRGYILCGVVHPSPFSPNHILILPNRTVVHNVLVGSVSFASPGAKALHNASTAQEITVITPSAANFEFRVRPSFSSIFSYTPYDTLFHLTTGFWVHDTELSRYPNDLVRCRPTHSAALFLPFLSYPLLTIPCSAGATLPRSHPPHPAHSWGSPSPRSSPVRSRRRSTRSASFGASGDEGDGVAYYDERERDEEQENRDRDRERERDRAGRPPSRTPPRERVITFDHLPNQSFRTAFILNRFSIQCNILYCSNDLLVQTTSCTGRSFFDFVAKKDEDIVRSWIDCVKGWGVNERGQPSDGGFGFGKFALLTEGRDSVERMAEPERRARQGSTNGHHHHGRARAARTASTASASAASGRRNINTRLSPTEIITNAPQIVVDAIFSAHSDGLMVILRRAET